MRKGDEQSFITFFDHLLLITLSSSCFHGENMGKGDKRTKRGKIFKGSYGKTRPHSPDKKKTGAASKQRPHRASTSR
jgi:30S ribosomal protein S31